MSGLAREYLAGLPQILNEHRRILFLGGPGMGLSSLAWQIQEYLISERGRKPILASLRSFDGKLSAILNPPRREGTDGEDLTGSSAWYLLDDLDQVGMFRC